jgi:dTDP-4-amino-4,6-dideoxygalactose transaminase
MARKILAVAEKYGLFVVEHAAQAISSFYKGKPLGSLGHLACFSFHETKNIGSGEGGASLINDERFIKGAEIIWEKETNRAAFYRGEIDEYTWVDIGSSFLLSEVTAVLLWAQLEKFNEILSRRLELWNQYYAELNICFRKLKSERECFFIMFLYTIAPFIKI